MAIKNNTTDETEEYALPIIHWDIRREGRSWSGPECTDRINCLIELKFEIMGGKLFWSDETRNMVLAMLLENMGMEAAVRFGDPKLWREAIDALEKEGQP